MAELASEIDELKPDTRDDDKSGTGREALQPPFLHECRKISAHERTVNASRTGQVDMLE